MAKPKTDLVVKRAVFLALLAETGNVTSACKRAKVARATVYEWRDADSAFAEEWERVVQAGKDRTADRIEASFDQRATDGWLEPVYQGGKLVGHVRKFDTTAGIVRLKALRPDLYRERSTVDLNVIPNMPARLDAAEKRLKNLKDRGE